MEFLFDGLDVGGNWSLMEPDVRFLDYWDVEWEEWEEQMVEEAESLAPMTTLHRASHDRYRVRAPQTELTSYPLWSRYRPRGRMTNTQTARFSGMTNTKTGNGLGRLHERLHERKGFMESLHESLPAKPYGGYARALLRVTAMVPVEAKLRAHLSSIRAADKLL